MGEDMNAQKKLEQEVTQEVMDDTRKMCDALARGDRDAAAAVGVKDRAERLEAIQKSHEVLGYHFENWALVMDHAARVAMRLEYATQEEADRDPFGLWAGGPRQWLEKLEENESPFFKAAQSIADHLPLLDGERTSEQYSSHKKIAIAGRLVRIDPTKKPPVRRRRERQDER